MYKQGLLAITAALVAHGSLLGAARALPPLPRTLYAVSNVDQLTWFEVGSPDGAPSLVGASAPASSGPSTPPSVAGSPDAQIAAASVDPATPTPSDRQPSSAAEAELAETIEEPEASGVADGPGPSVAEDGVAAAGPAPGGAVAPADEYSAPGGPEWGPSLGIPGVSAGVPGGLGLAGAIAMDNASGVAAPTTTPAAPKADKGKANEVLSSSLVGQDRAKGIDLPATGVVVTAVSTATRAVPVPHNTRASFEVKLGPGGKVLGVRVVSSSGGDAAGWEAAAKSVAGSLAGQSLALGDASKTGATVVVSVTVKHVFPTGTAKGADVKPVCANQIINDLADSLEDNKTAGPTESTVPIFTDENGRPCIPIGVGGTADAANIGATKQIQVQASSKVLIGGKEGMTDVKPVNKDPFWVPSTKEGPRPVAPYKMRKFKRDKEKKK